MRVVERENTFFRSRAVSVSLHSTRRYSILITDTLWQWCQSKGSNALPLRSPDVDKDRKRPGHWLGLVPCVYFSVLTLMIGWQEENPTCKRSIPLISSGAVTQRVERWICNQQVMGSNPTQGKSCIKPWASCSRLCASVTKQYNWVLAKGR